MNEATYQLDIAAEMLGCQQKKILSEWAKGTIQIVLNFGDKTRWERAKLFIDSSTQPNSEDFFCHFPGQRPQFSFDSVPLPPKVQQQNNEIEAEMRRELLRQYGQSGFNIPHNQRENAEMQEGGTIETEAYIFGLWCVSYNDYSRQQVQSSFTLTPYPVSAAPDGINVTYTPSSYDKDCTLAKKNLRITESDMAVMRKLLANRPGHQQAQSMPEELPKQPKSHGGIERFALEREKILAAALYVAHHFPKEVGKSFKSHAEAIAKHGYIFWQNEPTPDSGRIAKMLSDAARPPSEWKILGGNAKSK